MNDTSRADWVWNNTPNEDLARDLFNLSHQLERALAAANEKGENLHAKYRETEAALIAARREIADARDGALAECRKVSEHEFFHDGLAGDLHYVKDKAHAYMMGWQDAAADIAESIATLKSPAQGATSAAPHPSQCVGSFDGAKMCKFCGGDLMEETPDELRKAESLRSRSNMTEETLAVEKRMLEAQRSTSSARPGRDAKTRSLSPPSAAASSGTGAQETRRHGRDGKARREPRRSANRLD